MPLLPVDGTDIWFEVHGGRDLAPAVVMGGWGTFAHGAIDGVPQAVRDRCQVLVWDYPGVGESAFDGAHQPSMRRYAQITAALCDHLEWSSVHLMGIVDVGACIAQEVAIARPDLARSLFLTGCWARPDARLTDVLVLFRIVFKIVAHRTPFILLRHLSWKVVLVGLSCNSPPPVSGATYPRTSPYLARIFHNIMRNSLVRAGARISKLICALGLVFFTLH